MAAAIFTGLALLGLSAGVASAGAREAARASPLTKVTTLIANLKAEVEAEGKAEAKTYDEFACFCKTKTTDLSGGIKDSQDAIDELSADIEEATAAGAGKKTELGKQKAREEQLRRDLGVTEARCLKEQTAYEASNADLTKAILSLTGAVKAIESSKPASSSSLLAVRKILKQSSALDEAMQVLDQAPAWVSKARIFLQEGSTVDPQDPEFKFHSQDIISLLNKLLGDFTKEKTMADDEWSKTNENCIAKKQDLAGDISLAGTAIGRLEEDVEKLEKKIGVDRGSIVAAEGQLKDSKLYLEDLTAMCEERAKDWDQRSSARAGELGALSKALDVLTNNAADVEDVNKRALLLQQSRRGASDFTEATSSSAVGPSFLQQQRLRLATRGAAGAAAANAAAAKGEQSTSASVAMSTSSEARRARAVATLQEAGGRLRSTALAALAARVSEDPFAKVKDLVQDLLERLLQEATGEATKKSFCDQKLGTTQQDRDFRMSDVHKLAAEITTLEAREDELALEIKELGESIRKLGEDLAEAGRIRDEERGDNLRTLARAKQGKEAVAGAIDILTVFYKQAARSLVQTEAQRKASPVDQDTTGAGFEGSYKGKQAASEGILGILEVVESDFERTVKVTSEEEAAARAKFVEFERASKSDIGGRSTTKERDEEELDTTTRTKDTKMDDLKTKMNMVDSALRQLEELKPLCIDSGMSYDDRVAKREEEVAALRKSLCMLDGDSVEPDCA